MPATQVSPQKVFARLAERSGLMGEAYHRKRSLAPLVSAMVGARGDRLETLHLALAARLPKYRPAALLRELQEKHTLVRTWAPRGVLQVVPTAELPEFLAAAGVAPRWRRFLESRSPLSPTARLRLLKRLCPEEVSREALKAGFPDASMRQAILREAAQAGHILWTGGEGTAARFGWTKALLGREVEPERDVRHMVGRYLAAYGPVTAADLGAWLGVTVAAARQLMAKHHVDEVQVDGDPEPRFIRKEELEELEAVRQRAARGLVITPPGDPLASAFKTRWREADTDEAPGLVFVDGEAAGTWTLTKGEIAWDLGPQAQESAVRREIESLLERAGVEGRPAAAGA